MAKASDYRRSIPQSARPQAAAETPQAGRLQPTSQDILGPFYRPGAPDRTEFTDKPNLFLSLRVLDQQGNILSGACLDVWHADEGGEYDNDSPDFRFRGKLYTPYLTRNGEGPPVVLKTILPGDYKISEPGQPDDFRCAHVHFVVTAPGFKPLTTQLYFQGDPYNATDHWFDWRRMITGPRSSFDFVLEREDIPSGQ